MLISAHEGPPPLGVVILTSSLSLSLCTASTVWQKGSRPTRDPAGRLVTNHSSIWGVGGGVGGKREKE